jgi:hypothetical protein
LPAALPAFPIDARETATLLVEGARCSRAFAASAETRARIADARATVLVLGAFPVIPVGIAQAALAAHTVTVTALFNIGTGRTRRAATTGWGGRARGRLELATLIVVRIATEADT